MIYSKYFITSFTADFLYIIAKFMYHKIKTVYRKKRKTYNIKGHAHELTFSCYHQYNYLNEPESCELF